MADIKISLIVATDRNLAIGKDNAMLWHIPEDFKFFKRTTMGKPMVMGRKTFESLPGVLPGRAHLVVSRSGFTHDHEAVSGYSEFYAALNAAKKMAKEAEQDEVFIVGGAQIYALALHEGVVDRMYITKVDAEYEADAFFPTYNESEWREVSCEDHDGDPAFSFVTIERA